MEGFRQDAKYALRAMGKSPGFAAAAIVTLALAIGANTAIFSVVNGVLLRPLPYPDAHRIVQLWNSIPAANVSSFPLSAPEFEVVVWVTAYVPARWAARTDPLVALRYE